MSDLPYVLFITDNGHGLGHLTRMMAVARVAGDRFRPLFLTLSQAFPLVREFGWAAEYLPSYTKLGMATAEWEPIFASRVVNLMRHVEPRVVVIDHIRPPPILGSIRSESEGVDFIWSRRGMWREGRNLEGIRASGYFDAIIEPGDVATPIDLGLTVHHVEKVTAVNPVVFVGPEERTERNQARRSLGIPLEGKAVLIQLSDSDATKLAALIGQVRDVVRSVVGDGVVHLFAPLHVLHRGVIPSVDGVMMRPVYPMATHLRAFDGIISTAGYNSFHEVVASGVPAVFVARDAATLDDQVQRASFAELCGRGFYAPTVYDVEFRRAVERLLRPEEAAIAARVTEDLGSFDGAAQFADVIATRSEARSDGPDVTVGLTPVPPREDTLERVRSGRSLPEGAEPEAERLVVIALGFQGRELSHLADRIGESQEVSPNFKPVFLVDDVDTQSLDAWGFQFETIMSASEWDTFGSSRYETYVQSCIAGMQERYLTREVLTPAPGSPVDPTLFSRDQVRTE